MIKAIKPSQYKSVESEDTKNNKSQSSFQVEEQSEEEEDSDLQIQVVDTEQRGNEVIYKISNYLLILFAIFIIIVYYIQVHQSETVLINNIEHIEISTIYQTSIQGKKTEVTMFLPNRNINEPQQIKLTAEFCMQYYVNDCSRQILMHQKYLFLQLEQWVTKNLQDNKRNVLVFWEERLSLAVLLLNLNRQEKIWIDVIINEEDSPIYLQSFDYNLRRYGLDNYVRSMRQMQVTTNFLKDYSLVIGSNAILDKIVYPQALQYAVFQGNQQLTSGIIYDIIFQTNLLIYYNQSPTNQSRTILQELNNQITSIKVNSNNQVQQQRIDNINSTFRVILLDGRKKIIHNKSQTQQEQISQIQQIQTVSQLNISFQPIQFPLKQIHRLLPENIIKFFKCTTSNKSITQVGYYYKSKFNDLSILKADQDEQQYPTYLYNFIYHYLLSIHPCNILYALHNNVLANIAAQINAGQFYLTTNLEKEFAYIFQNLKVNHLFKNVHEANIDKLSLHMFLYHNEISLVFVTNQIFMSWYQQLVWALNLNINIIIKYEANIQQYLDKVVKDFYIFAILQGNARQFDNKCIKNFEIQYYQGKSYQNQTYLLISKINILIEEINPQFYNRTTQRHLRHKKHQCFRNFNKSQLQNTNLKKQQLILVIDNSINLIVQSRYYEQSIQAMRKDESIIFFLKNSLSISDNILIYTQNPSMFLLVNIFKSITFGQTYFNNMDQLQIDYIERNAGVNDFSNYQFATQKIEDLQRFVAYNKITVLFLSPLVIKQSHAIIPKMKKGSMIFFNYQIKDKELERTLQTYTDNVKLFQVTSIKDNENIYNLCFNYQVNEVAHFASLSTNIWVVMIIKTSS